MSRSSRLFSNNRPISKPILFQQSQKDTKTQSQSHSTPSIQKANNILDKAKYYYRNNKILQTISCLTLQNNPIKSSQANYILVVCYMTINKYDYAINHIQKIFKQKQSQYLKYRNKLLIMKAICLKKKQLFKDSLDTIEQALQVQQIAQQQKLQFCFLKANILMIIKKYNQAVQTFNILQNQIKKINFTSSQKQVAFQKFSYRFDLIRCYIKLNQQLKCFQKLDQLFVQRVQNDNFNNFKLIKLKLQCLIHFEKYKQAKQILQSDFYTLIQKQSQEKAQYYYFKGIIAARLSNQQCIIHWNQALSTTTSNQNIIICCLEQLSIYYMMNRDFYQALQYLKRKYFLFPQVKQQQEFKKKKNIHLKYASTDCIKTIQKLNIKQKSFNQLLKIAEGVTDLMKRKFEDAKENFLKVNLVDFQIQNLYYHKKFLKNLYYNALGFTYFSIGDHSRALAEYKKMDVSNEQIKDEQKEFNFDKKQYQKVQWKQFYYNTTLCNGIIASKIDQDDEKAIQLFQQCTNYLIRSQPYFYISVLLIRKSFKQMADTQIFMKVLNILDSGLKVGQNSNMFYYRALLYVYLGMNSQALQDVDKAIQKSEDNVAKYFFLRGVIFMLDRNYQQAVSQMSTCLSIDQKFTQAYLERAKCNLILGQNIASAYMDIFEHPDHQKWKKIFNIYQKQFTNLQIDKIESVSLKQAVNFHLYKFEQSGAGGKLILAAKYQNFQQLIPLLDQALQINLSVGPLHIQDIMLLKAFCAFKIQKLQQCAKMLCQVQQNIRSYQKSDQYGQDDQSRLLMIRLNLIFITLKQKKYEQALNQTQQLCQEVYQGQIYDKLRQFYGFLIKIDKHRILKLNTENQEVLIQYDGFNQHFQLKLFETLPTLSQYFDYQETSNIKFKFWLPMPKIKIPQLYDPSHQKLLTNFYIEDVQNKPEAPWIKRGEHGIIFTNDIQNFDNLSINTQEDNKARLKQSLQLGSDILAKLNKITKKDSH